MSEPLAVDPSRLETAGAKLASLVFPPPPVPVTATGTDSVSTAIDETMPGIEAPAVDGLTAAQTALTQTSTNIATAAAMYASTDRTLGDQFNQSQFDQPTVSLGGVPSLGGLLRADADIPVLPTIPDTKEIAPALNSLSQTAQTVGSTTQSIVQSVQGATGNASSAAPASAKTVSDTNPDPSADQTQDDEKDKEQTDSDQEQLVAFSEGAAPAQQATAGAPIPRSSALA